MVERNLAKVDVVGSNPIIRFIELLYNISMKEITDYDLRSFELLHNFFNEAYVNNDDVLIPSHFLKNFVDMSIGYEIGNNDRNDEYNEDDDYDY